MYINFLILINSIAAAKYGLTFDLLKNVRSNITFLPYTPHQRVQVAKGAQALFSVYVNRFAKMNYYKSEFPNIDPVPRMDAIAALAYNMTDEEFHTEMSNLFLSLRDMHTNYYLPGPHSCFFPALPMVFDFVTSINIEKFPTVVISRFARFPELIEKAGEDVGKMSVGDVLLKVNGLTFNQFYEKYKWLANGSNRFANMRAVAGMMTSRGGLLQLMPEEDVMEFEFLSRKNLLPYKIKLNWVAIRDDECYAETMHEYSKITGVPMPHIPKVSHLVDTKFMNGFKPLKANEKTWMMAVPFPYLKETLYPKALEYGVQYTPTSDSTISWTVYQSGDFALGVIRLESFVPDNQDAMNAVMIIRSLLVNELSETDGLVFDVRSNGGGLITMADGIPQLFVKDFVQPGFRSLVSPTNKKIFSNTKFWPADDGFAIAYNEAGDADRFTYPVQIESTESVNKLGTAYTKPVGVFTNAECYSACDCFSANMQDSGAAVIFGEDGTTGAGGANVLEYNYLREMDDSDFPELPFSKLKHGAPNFRVGWRQQVRNGINAGKIIEDYGIYSEVITRPRTVDITVAKSSNSSTQFNRIVDELRKMGQKTKRDAIYFKSEPIDSEQEINQPVSFNITFSGLTKFKLLDEYKNVLKESEFTSNFRDRYDIVLSSEVIQNNTGIRSFTIQGFKDDVLIVHTHRNVRFLPSKVDYYELGAYSNLNWDFAPAPYIAIYNLNSPPDLGWNADPSGDQLVIGNGIEYSNNVRTQLSVFVKANPDLGRPPMLSLVADYDTELGFDFFQVGYKAENGTNVVLALVSGLGSLNLEESLVEMGETTEIYFLFVSDPAVNAKGVNITNLMLGQKLLYRGIMVSNIFLDYAGEISGAFGDFGTLIPILVSLSINDQINITTSLIFGGLFNIISGYYFKIPLPVQPMKSIAAIALISNLKNAEIASAGLTVSIALAILAISGAIKFFFKYIPLYLVRGIQLGTGAALILRGISSINSSHRWSFSGGNATDNYLLAIISFVLVMSYWKSKNTLSALLLFVVGMIIAGTQVDRSLLVFGPKFWIPSYPTREEFLHGFLTAGLGQIPLTISNSVIAVVVLAKDLFPNADFNKITVTKISIWVSLMNFIAVWFGSTPYCCGSGGLAAQYRFGSRTHFSVIFLGFVKILAGLLFGSSFANILKEIPSSVVGVLLIVAGFQISLITLDFGVFDSEECRQDAYLCMIATAFSTVGFANDGIGFFIGGFIAVLLYWPKYVSSKELMK